MDVALRLLVLVLAMPIACLHAQDKAKVDGVETLSAVVRRSEEHTSELQSLV